MSCAAHRYEDGYIRMPCPTPGCRFGTTLGKVGVVEDPKPRLVDPRREGADRVLLRQTISFRDACGGKVTIYVWVDEGEVVDDEKPENEEATESSEA